MTLRGTLQIERDKLLRDAEDQNIDLVTWIERVREWVRKVRDNGYDPRKDFA